MGNVLRHEKFPRSPRGNLLRAAASFGGPPISASGGQRRVAGHEPVGPEQRAALMGVQRNLEVHLFDHNKTVRSRRSHAISARPITATQPACRLAPDILVECTGVPAVIHDCLGSTAASGIVCLAGVTAPHAYFNLDLGLLNRTLALENDVVFGTVTPIGDTTGCRPMRSPAPTRGWLGPWVTRIVPLRRVREAFEHRRAT